MSKPESPLTKAQVERYADELLHTSVNLTARKLVIRIAQAAAQAAAEAEREAAIRRGCVCRAGWNGESR